MLTILIILVTIFITNKLTRMYCILRYKNDVEFIKNVMNENVVYDVKRNSFNLEEYLKEVITND